MNQVWDIARPNRWLYIDFNSYFASVEQELNPALRGKPVAVVAVMTDATCAIAASYEAKAYGIKTGTPIWEARAKCPELICVLGSHEKYVEYHARAIAEVENHIPVTMVCSIDEIACRLMSNENSHARATQIAESIKRGLARNVGASITCSIGIAPNRYLAKVATDMQKPDGLTFLNASDLPEKLYSLILRDLPGIGHNMEKRLNRQGIWAMRDLLALDAKQMRRLWGGIWGERMWHYLHGVELADIETTRSSVGHSHVMAPELRAPEKARYVARRLTLKAASRLRRLGYQAAALSFSMRIENGPRLATEARCVPASDSMTFLHLLDQLWVMMLDEAHAQGIWPMCIKKLSVTLHHLQLQSDGQAHLFSALTPEDSAARAKAERMSQALDALNQRYGRDTVALGMLPTDGRSFSGTKIAFTRIPDAEEFLE
jgi:DNA polymerase-4